jgi:hypothetical protein
MKVINGTQGMGCPQRHGGIRMLAERRWKMDKDCPNIEKIRSFHTAIGAHKDSGYLSWILVFGFDVCKSKQITGKKMTGSSSIMSCKSLKKILSYRVVSIMSVAASSRDTLFGFIEMDFVR